MAGFKQLLKVSSWARIVPGIKEAVVRFPLPFIFVIGANLVAILAFHHVLFASGETIARLLVSLSYATVALTALKIFVESKNWSTARYAIATVVVVAVVVLFAVFVFNKESFSSSTYFGAALCLSLLFAPYIKSGSDQPSVWYFNYQTGVAVFFGGLAALVLSLGIVIILASLEYLFTIKIPSNLYGDVWILGWGVLFPVYVLANISRQFDYETEACEFPKGIRFITNYILLPLMVVYMAILYAYFARIVVKWELPRGKLTWMIAAFGALGIVTKLLAYPIRNSGTRLLAWFDRYYYYALIVPLILLAIAIGVRIHDYGFTEQRYTVVLMAVWFSCLVLLSIYKRDRFHIKYVPMILAVLLLVGCYGPWSAVEVSMRSQVGRFESLLLKNQMLHNGQVVRASTKIPFADRKRMSSIADYLCKSEERFKRISPWFKTLLAEDGKKESLQCNRIGSRQLVKLMGVDYVYRWQSHADNVQRFDYNNQVLQINKQLLDVSGFDYVGHGTIYQYYKKDIEYKLALQHESKRTTVTVSRKGQQIIVKDEAGDSLSFDIGRLVRKLRKQQVTTVNQAAAREMALTANSGDGKLKARLVLEQIQGSVSAENKVDITYMQYVLLLKFSDSQ